jgi:hypothetical protein
VNISEPQHGSFVQEESRLVPIFFAHSKCANLRPEFLSVEIYVVTAIVLNWTIYFECTGIKSTQFIALTSKIYKSIVSQTPIKMWVQVECFKMNSLDNSSIKLTQNRVVEEWDSF